MYPIPCGNAQRKCHIDYPERREPRPLFSFCILKLQNLCNFQLSALLKKRRSRTICKKRVSMPGCQVIIGMVVFLEKLRCVSHSRIVHPGV